MRLFHATTPDAAAAILAGGFRDSEGSYLFVNLTLRGVWVSNIPLGVNEGAKGGVLLAVTLPDDVDLADFEIVDPSGDSGYREWCVPAALLNNAGEVRALSDVEVDDLLAARWSRNA